VPTLTKGRVCSFQLLLAIASAVFVSESSGTHDHILLSQFLKLSKPGGQGSCVYFPQDLDVQLSLRNLVCLIHLYSLIYLKFCMRYIYIYLHTCITSIIIYLTAATFNSLIFSVLGFIILNNLGFLAESFGYIILLTQLKS
jgi:hypothetical protein